VTRTQIDKNVNLKSSLTLQTI